MTPLNTIIEEEKKEFIEKGADIEHGRWSKWQAHLHSKCVEHSDGKGEWVCFPSELFKRWERQINTPYSELSEAEKESDREQVRSYDALLTTAMQRAYEAKVGIVEVRWEDSKDELYTYFGHCPCGASCVIVGSKYCSECGERIKNPLRSEPTQPTKEGD